MIPVQNLLVLGPEILGNLQLPARVLHQELLLDGLIEDRSQVRAGLFYPVLVVAIRELIDMRLQHESVDGFERENPELVDQIDLNLSHLFLGCLGSPVSLSKRKITVPNEPLEGGGTVF
ncbi:hypothetical protein [Terriglobus sp. RCC_193]|uniref:hypothetical protein n=1 Tax=Terriglobus sp. RCC_193 TaxID=3239218 RepID=UPI003526999D